MRIYSVILLIKEFSVLIDIFQIEIKLFKQNIINCYVNANVYGSSCSILFNIKFNI